VALGLAWYSLAAGAILSVAALALLVAGLMYGRGRAAPLGEAVLKALPDLIIRLRRDGTYLGVGGTWRDLLLYRRPESLVGRTLADMLPPDVAREAITHLARAFETGEVQVHECQLPAEGALRDYEVRITANSTEEAVLVIRDITVRKRSEEALRKAEAELRRVIGAISDSVWSVEVNEAGDLTWVYHSPVGRHLTGRPPEYFTSMKAWFEIVHPEDRARIAGLAGPLLRAERSREAAEFRMVLPDGTIRWVRSSITCERIGPGLVRLDGVDADITAEREAQAALREAKEALEAIIDASPLVIFSMGLNCRIQRWNRASERVFGWSEQEALGARLPLLPAEQLNQFCSGSVEAMTGGAETSWNRKDGGTVELSVWRAPLRDASGTVRGSIVLAADVGERKSLEQQLQQAQRMEAVGRLAGGVAHDFNNLLTVITGYGHMLLDDLAANADAHKQVEEILRAVERASALTNQLLAFSRRQVAKPRIIDINDLVLNMDRLLRRVIGEDIELVTALDPSAGKIEADPVQIEQVLMNLVVNSRDAMPGGGKLIIETESARLDEGYARVHMTVRAGEYVRLSVIDTGCGMDEDTKARIFEPFFTTKEQGKGTGLGLATVYGIVKQNEGDITVTSEPGRGTRFNIYLPQANGTVEESDDKRQETSVARGTETVLVVEDEEEVRRLVRAVLEPQGYKVLVAGWPEEAIELCREYQGQVELLLTDVVMPQMGGRELAQVTGWIRPDMKVLFMSGYTDDAMLGRSLSEPGVDFLRKPFTPAELTRKIRQVLDRDDGQPNDRGARA